MKRRTNPVLPCADAGPFGAAISLKYALQRACGRKMARRSAKSGWGNQHICTACRDAIDRPAHRSPQP